jgi:hypothetical protein
MTAPVLGFTTSAMRTPLVSISAARDVMFVTSSPCRTRWPEGTESGPSRATRSWAGSSCGSAARPGWPGLAASMSLTYTMSSPHQCRNGLRRRGDARLCAVWMVTVWRWYGDGMEIHRFSIPPYDCARPSTEWGAMLRRTQAREVAAGN